MTTTSEKKSMKKLYSTPNEHKIEMFERVHAVKLRYIIENAEEFQLDELVHTWGQNTSNDGQLTILQKYLKKVKQGKVKVWYRQNNKRGRYFVNKAMGLQCIARPVRHTICREYYYDVDINNAHPVFLLDYCKKKGLVHTELEKYVKHRQDYFDELKKEKDMKRESSKKLFLKILNGGVPSEEDEYPESVVDFYNELRTTRESVMELNPDLVKLAKKNLKKRGKSEYNIDGSVVNLLMCDIENKILMEMVNFFHSKRLKIDVLCFDGLMIQKEKVSEESLTKLMRECEEYIKTEMKIDILLDIKEMNEGLELPDLEDKTYEGVKTEFEKHNFKCIDTATFFNVDHDMVRCKTKKDTVSAYEHLNFINEDGKEQVFINKWFKDPDMRKYEFVRCIPPPLKCDNYTYNLWDGFSVEREKEKDSQALEILKAHIKLLCNNDDKIFEFVMLWLACLFQKPAFKNNVALFFKSKQGLGKDLFYTMLEKMIGGKYCGNTSRPERDIFGDFNSFLQNKLLVVMNEFSGNVGFKYSDKLKDLITNVKEPIRKMRTDVSEKELSFCHYMFFTNNDFPIKIERGDRRLFVCEIKQPIPPKEYFDRLVDAINNPKALRALYDELMSKEISHMDWIKDKPITEYMSDLIENSQDRELTFLIQKLKTAHNDEEKELKIKSKDLLEEFKDDCLQNGYEYRTSAIKFGIKMKKYHIQGFSTKRTKAGNVYIFNIEECIIWLIREKFLPEDYLDLEAEQVRLLRTDRLGTEEKFEEEGFDLFNQGTALK